MNLSALLKMYDFSGRSIVITGGAGVLCGAMTKALIGCGANVAILARSREKGEAALDGVSGPGRGMIVVGDVLKKETLQAAARAASLRGSSITILPDCSCPAASNASGTPVDLPAPGGACSTTFAWAATAARSAGSAESMGKPD